MSEERKWERRMYTVLMLLFFLFCMATAFGMWMALVVGIREIFG